MFRKLEQLIFPLFLITIFVFFPILFSFNDESLTLYFNDSSSNTSEKRILERQFVWGKSSSTELESKFDSPFPLYDPYRVSIFANAVESLMKHYISVYEPLQITDVSTDQMSKKAYLAAYGKPLPSIPPRQQYRRSNEEPAEKFFFANYDEYKNVFLPQQLISNGHMAVKNQFVSLPRTITEKDFKVKFSADKVESMYVAHYKDYFGFDFQSQFGKDPKTLRPKKIRRTLETYWGAESRVRNQAYLKLRKDLLENDSVVKLTGCRYSSEAEKVIVYYDLKSDLFCIVGEKTNSFITGGVASLCDYIDLYYFKWLYNNKAFDKSIQFFDKPIQFEVDIDSNGELNPGVSEDVDFDLNRDKGLAQNYNPANWWQDAQKDLEKRFLQLIHKDNAWYDNLRVGDDGTINEGSEFEGFTMLQLQAEKYVIDIYRPNKPIGSREKKLDTDARFESVNSELIQNCNPTIIDIKALIDPGALASRSQENIRSLEQQVDDATTSVKFQQVRSKTEFNETVLHVINLFRVRPVDRPFVIALFKAKSIQKGVDLNCVVFLNTNEDLIY